MKLQISKSILVNALTKVEKAVGKSQLPVLQGIYLEVAADKLTFVGAGDEQIIIVKLPVDETIVVAETGSIVMVKGSTDIIKRTNSDLIEINSNGATYQVISGQGKFEFVGYEADQYPKVDAPEQEGLITFTYDELKYISERLSFAAATNDSRPILKGFNFTGSKQTGFIRVVATDSFSLSQVIMEKPLKEDISITPAAKSLNDALKVFNSSDSIEVSVTNSYLVFKNAETTIFARLLEGNFPDTSGLIVKEYPILMTLDKQSLLSALEQIEIVGTNSQEAAGVTLTLDGINLVLENSDKTNGNAVINVPLVELNKPNEEATVSDTFNVRYLISTIRATEGQVIRFGYQASMRPLSILGEEMSLKEYKLILPTRSHSPAPTATDKKDAVEA